MWRRNPLFFYTILSIPEFIVLIYSSAVLSVFVVASAISLVLSFIVEYTEYLGLLELLQYLRLNYVHILRWILERLFDKLQILRDKSRSRQERRENFIDLFAFVTLSVMSVCILFTSPEYIIALVGGPLLFIFLFWSIKVLNFFFKEISERLRLLIINLSSRYQKFYDLLDEEHRRKSSNWVQVIQRLLCVPKRTSPTSGGFRVVYQAISNFYKVRRAFLYWCVCLLFIISAPMTAHVYFVNSVILLLVLDIIFIK